MLNARHFADHTIATVHAEYDKPRQGMLVAEHAALMRCGGWEWRGEEGHGRTTTVRYRTRNGKKGLS